MKRSNWLRGMVIGLLLGAARGSSAVPIVPDTTVAAETGNNTSAANSFATLSADDNLGASNISKVPTASLLTQSQTKIFSELQPWFCMPGSPNCGCNLTSTPQRCNGHILTGYNANDAVQVQKQVNDMISRGISGTIIDWYGPSGDVVTNQASLKIRTEAEKHTPAQFQFAIMTDGGQYKGCAADPACNVENAIINDLVYAGNNFAVSSNYMHAADGKPIMFFFNPDLAVVSASSNTRTINWTTVANGVASFNYVFIFQNAGGYTHAVSGGGFAWPQPTTVTDPASGFTYLNNFYKSSIARVTAVPAAHAYGTTYKGFDDVLAGWSPPPPKGPRLIGQSCGQTWLQTFSIINSNYPAGKAPLENIQIATWNDYDEGTEIETGIDNCVSIVAAMNNTTNTLSWTVTGSTNTLDHFTVFASADDINLMTLQDNIVVSARSLNLATFGLPANTHLRVKAVGKPSVLNHLSTSVLDTVAPASSACDVNGDGTVNVTDVQQDVNAAIGSIACAPAFDINKDGACNVIDVQRTVNAALGGPCVSP